MTSKCFLWFSKDAIWTRSGCLLNTVLAYWIHGAWQVHRKAIFIEIKLIIQAHETDKYWKADYLITVANTV
jgi:hypothetical protein